ncbi:MAG: FecR domain-containing protein [Alphaproteobacteria bacterium]
MSIRSIRKFGAVASMLMATVYAATAFAAVGDKAGVAGAVRGNVQLVSYQTPTATTGKKVLSGDQIVLGDKINTGPDSGLQVMLLDETTFTIGPNSTLVIDEYVFDPATGAGKMTASVVKGSFRFVSGKIARTQPENMNIKLPNGSIGIRGTIVVGQTDGIMSTILLAGVGYENDAARRASWVVVSAGGKDCEIRRQGFAVTIAGPGQKCSDPFRPADTQKTQLIQSTGLALVVPANSTDLPGLPGNTLPPINPNLPGDKAIKDVTQNHGTITTVQPGCPTVTRSINLGTRSRTTTTDYSPC